MFQGKNIVVTGGSRGIGAEIVREFCRQGANIIFTYNSNKSRALELKSSLEEKYANCTISAICCDLSIPEQVEDFYNSNLEALDCIDVLVNNAGITNDSLLVMMKESAWMDVLQLNLNSVFLLTKKVAFKMMGCRHGSIINISSVSGVYGNVGQTNYSASKAGLIGFSKSLSKELAPQNIRVNVVAPGFIDTDMTSKLDDKSRNTILSDIGLKRFGKPKDVALLVSFLASESASYITGQTLIIDGGLKL